jgi:glycolate oxidase iron-sulfur subunit
MSDHVLDPDGELRGLAGDCVHCGFCLPACPTYQLWGEEMDSPRGRIHLITQILDGAPGTEAAATHLDRCLGCMACVPACPSGVRYDRLIEAAREWAQDPADHHHPAGEPQQAQLGNPDPSPELGLALTAGQDGPPPDGTAADGTAGDGAARGGTGAERPGTTADEARRGRALPARSLRDRAVRRAIFETFPYPRRLRLLTAPLRAAQRTGLDRLVTGSDLVARLAPELTAALQVAPAPARPTAAGNSRPRGLGGRVRPATRPPTRIPARIPARGSRRAFVGMLTGCVQQVFFPEVNAATARVLAAEGCDVIVPPGQGCCGALSLHGGRRTEAAAFARRTIETFERAGVDALVVNAAGCGSALKEYGQLLAGDPGWSGRAAALAAKVLDFSEFLAGLGPVATRHPLPVAAVYQDACHLGHAQGITRQPRELLAAIPGLEVAEIGDGGTCCGSAGIYNLVQPAAAAELGARKARGVQATGARLLISANPGCALQISSALAAQGTPMPVAHIAEVLDASIRALPPSALLTR